MARDEVYLGDGTRLVQPEWKVSMVMTDIQMGALRVSVDGAGKHKAIPFTFGPFTGIAYLTSELDVQMDQAVTVKFDLALYPEVQPTAAALLAAAREGVTVDG